MVVDCGISVFANWLMPDEIHSIFFLFKNLVAAAVALLKSSFP
jgi:hypothetical protein